VTQKRTAPCHPVFLEKSSETIDCKRVVKHSWEKERKERRKERLRWKTFDFKGRRRPRVFSEKRLQSIEREGVNFSERAKEAASV
jgi:hypothetical protein